MILIYNINLVQYLISLYHDNLVVKKSDIVTALLGHQKNLDVFWPADGCCAAKLCDVS